MKKIILAGGSGFVGRRLTTILLEVGHQVAWLSRNQDKNAPVEVVEWKPSEHQLDAKQLEGFDAIINLAGAGIADKRWTDARKKRIIQSRTDSAKTLEKALLKCKNPPKHYLAASAIGYYGDRGEDLLTENSKAGEGFLSESVIAWENATQSVHENTGLRTVVFRIGVVLGKGGGALQEIEKPMNFGMANYFGDGQMWYSWIHIDDLCRMFLWALENEQLEGVFNATAPNPSRNKQFTQVLKEKKGGFALVAPVPEFMMKLVLGEMAHVVLDSAKVSSQKVQDAGFEFRYSDLEKAFGAVYKK